jgi:hypothetical protein
VDNRVIIIDASSFAIFTFHRHWLRDFTLFHLFDYWFSVTQLFLKYYSQKMPCFTSAIIRWLTHYSWCYYFSWYFINFIILFLTILI